MADAVTCSLLPNKMREFAEEWKSSGSIAAFDFGTGIVTASNITTDVEIQSGSLETRLDSFALDYQTAWAFGPIETGSVVSGSVTASWRAENSYSVATQTGSIILTRENDAGTNWRSSGLTLFTYTGSALQEIDLTFDQSGRPVVSADRRFVVADVTQSFVWLHRFVTAVNDFQFGPVTTGSTARVILDDPIDVTDSDILLFYRKNFTSEQLDLVSATGSGVSDDFSSSYCDGDVTLSLNPYKFSNPVSELGIFSSRAGTGVSEAITGSFNIGVNSVGATIVDPDFNPNLIIAFDQAGNEIQRKQFLSDGIPRHLTKDTQVLTKEGDSGTGSAFIKTFLLVPAPADYVSYDQILFSPSGGCTLATGSTFSTQQIYYRQQRENFTVERAVPLNDAQFLETVDFVFGIFSGTFGQIDPVGFTDSRMFPTSSFSGTLGGSWSGSFTGAAAIYSTGSGVSGSFSSSICNGAISISINPYSDRVGAGGSQGQFQSNLGSGVSAPYTMSLSPPGARRVGVTAIDVNFLDNLFIIKDQTGAEIQQTTFDFPVTSSTKFLTASGDEGTGSVAIRIIEVRPNPTSSGTGDYLPLDALLIDPWPTLNIVSCSGESGSWDGRITGSFTGSGGGFGTGSFSGSFSGSGDLLFRGSVPTGSTSQSLLGETQFLYELFLEDVVKLVDNRVALYISRRNIDSGSDDLGEYKVNKFETILFPQRVAEDQWSSSVDLFTSSLIPVIQHSNFDVEFIQSMSFGVPDGSSSLRETIITHSNFDVEFIQSMSFGIPSGSSSLREAVITHSVFDVDAYVSYSMAMQQATTSLDLVVITHSVFDKEAYVSYSMAITSGSFETA